MDGDGPRSAHLLGGIGQILLTSSYRHAGVSTLAPFDYVSMLWALTLGYFIFGNFPDALTWVGALIIIGSGLYIAMRERKRLGIR